MTEWSYSVKEWTIPESSFSEELEKRLDEMGDDRWELVSINMETVFITKRAILVVAIFKSSY